MKEIDVRVPDSELAAEWLAQRMDEMLNGSDNDKEDATDMTGSIGKK